jgi:regulator of protease activity HflC (stomatin/prohibitin superfamily)
MSMVVEINSRNPKANRLVRRALLAIGAGVLLLFGSAFWITVPPGYVAVATLFGDVRETPYDEGLHVPVNPFYDWYWYDTRQKTHMERALVPSRDQLQTQVDVSVQYRAIRSMAPRMLKETGALEDAVTIHLVPKLRSVLREQGKSVVRAEDFFNETTQVRLQVTLLESLKEFLEPIGIEVQAVLLRDITLPAFISKAIESKKEREQAAEKQKAELERFRTEQQQKIAQAEAERMAAEEEAARRRTLADAQAYEIIQVNKALGESPGYIRLRALDALKEISKDPAAKIYFLDGDSPMPLPLMHLGEK